MPGIDLPSGIKPLNPVPVEYWSGPYSGINETAAKLVANTAIPSAIRFATMEVSLVINGIGYKYWYKNGTSDGDLTLFESSSYTPDYTGSIKGTALVNPGVTILSLGDSFTEGYTASNPATKGYVPILSNHLNTISEQHAVGGSGALNAIKQLLDNTLSINNEKVITYLSGFNDIKLSGDNPKTYQKLKGCLKSVIANSYLKDVISAESSTYSGWTPTSETIAVSKSNMQLSAYPLESSTLGDSFQYSFEGDNLVIGTFGVDNSNVLGGVMTIIVDGLSNLTYTFDNRNLTDGITDFQSLSNDITPNVVFLTGLGTGSHTVEITTTNLETGGKVFLDYIGVLNNPQVCKPILVGEIPKILNWNLYPPYNNGSDEIVDKADAKYKEAINEFITYPVYWSPTNTYFNKNTDINTDQVHPNDLGYSHIAKAFETTVIPYSASSEIGNPLSVTTGAGDSKGMIGVYYGSWNSEPNCTLLNFAVNRNPVTGIFNDPSKSAAQITLVSQQDYTECLFFLGDVPDSLDVSNIKAKIDSNGLLTINDIKLTSSNYTTGGYDVIVRNQSTGKLEKISFLDDIYKTTSDFLNSTDCEIPSLDGKRYRINWRGYGFLIPTIEWETITGGGFKILIPGFDVTLDPNNTFQIQQY